MNLNAKRSIVAIAFVTYGLILSFWTIPCRSQATSEPVCAAARSLLDQIGLFQSWAQFAANLKEPHVTTTALVYCRGSSAPALWSWPVLDGENIVERKLASRHQLWKEVMAIELKKPYYAKSYAAFISKHVPNCKREEIKKIEIYSNYANVAPPSYDQLSYPIDINEVRRLLYSYEL
jgi:hypothetical protein